ncbi:MAG: ABC transporter ATP-binding protein [Gemmatales bacterium]|nr:MAG: ABC transporter ATP-binding protein [Gemmatales bacterium]
MLEIHHLRKCYAGPQREIVALDDVSLTVKAGEFCAVQGPSGCGKTTLLLSAGGLLQPDQGEVLINGEDVYAFSPDKRAAFRAANVGFVFQQFHLVPYLNVLENVLASTLPLAVPDAEQRAMRLLERLGLADRREHVPAELSTGERQRTALARALLHEPKLLLADEPTGNLDADNAAAVLGYLREFVDHGGAVLLVTHDPRAAAEAGTIIHLRNGRIVDSATISSTPSSPQTSESG